MSASLLPRFSQPGSPPRLSASPLDSCRALTPLSLLLLDTTCSAPPLRFCPEKGQRWVAVSRQCLLPGNA